MMAFALLFFWAVDGSAVWQDANHAYEAGNYQAALAGYLKLLESGHRNGQLHFNTGNAFYKTGGLGRAILHYYRALEFLPGDRDVLHNLAIANGARMDPQIDEENEAFFHNVNLALRRLHYSWIFYAALACLVLAGLASLTLVMRPHAGKWLGYVLVLSGLLALLLGGLAMVQYHQLTRRDFAVVLAAEQDVLAGPSSREPVNFTVHEGIRCQILESRPGWYRIRLANGFNGWLPRAAIEFI